MKINFIMPGLGNSGGIKVIKKYAELMKTQNNDVIIFCSIKADNLHRYDSELKNRVHQIYCTLKTFLEMIRGDKPWVKWVWSINEKSIRSANATIATAWTTAYRVSKLPSKCGKKMYFIQDIEIWDNLEWGINSYYLPLEKIVISTWINKTLKEKLNIGPFPVVLNGIDTELFNNQGKKHDNRVISFLMLNHEMEKKGVKQGIEVYEKISTKYSNIRLRMFGMCSNNNLPDYVDYYKNPSIEKLVDLYSTSDIFIFSSLEEGWGLAPLEAMACGCVVVGTRTGFVLDLGRHGVNMMVSEPGDVEEMVHNIEELLNGEKYKLFIEEGRRTALCLSWENSCKKFIEYLE